MIIGGSNFLLPILLLTGSLMFFGLILSGNRAGQSFISQLTAKVRKGFIIKF